MKGVHCPFISLPYGRAMNTQRLICMTAIAAALVGCGSSNAAAPVAKYKGFTARVTNPWYPLKPGSVYVYRGVKDGQPSREVMTVTDRTRMIDGAPCVVVSDLLYLRGRLEERTTDYYTQDARGRVWYFGEKTAELDRNGNIKNTSGSWLAGVRGAKPGIFMFTHPSPGQSARQEYYKGEAEDHFQVLRLNVPAKVPYRSFPHTLLTKEWTPLEPGVIDHKYYVRGIGTVLEKTAKGPVERNELVSFKRGT
jgi:hypothetical protein